MGFRAAFHPGWQAGLDLGGIPIMRSIVRRSGMVLFVSTRELSRQPGKVRAKVSEEGPQVITQNGVPAAYLI